MVSIAIYWAWVHTWEGGTGIQSEHMQTQRFRRSGQCHAQVIQSTCSSSTFSWSRATGKPQTDIEKDAKGDQWLSKLDTLLKQEKYAPILSFYAHLIT